MHVILKWKPVLLRYPDWGSNIACVLVFVPQYSSLPSPVSFPEQSMEAVFNFSSFRPYYTPCTSKYHYHNSITAVFADF